MKELVKNIFLTENPAVALNKLLARLDYSSLIIIDDENTHQHCFPKLGEIVKDALIITIPAGEEHKNLSTCEKVWSSMTEANVDRNAIVLNIGGGVVGDLGGFCASTYKRGIRFINLPTTLLAQVDASIGGKQGIDFKHFKNQIGVFQQPEYVIINPDFLQTLPNNELISGYAEVVKHALIQSISLWTDIKGKSEVIRDDEIVAKAIQIKHQVVKNDPLEHGERKLLNFGHTLGHAVESYLLSQPNRKILHGEAVAAGMIMEGWLSWKLNFLKEEEFQEIRGFIAIIFPKVQFEEKEINEISSYLQQDKKNFRGELRFTLLKTIGSGIFDIPVSMEDCKRALKEYLK